MILFDSNYVVSFLFLKIVFLLHLLLAEALGESDIEYVL